MESLDLPLLSVPVLLWAGMGVVLLLAVRRSTSERILRLAATFVALWALLATTALLWVVAHGGWGAAEALIQAPQLLFAPAAAPIWLWGALGAFLLLCAAFLLNQAVGRGFLFLYRSDELPWPPSLPRPPVATSLRALDSARPEAFSFTLLELDSRRLPRRREVILLSTGLLSRLDGPETEAVIAHELGHVRELDSRYLTFFRTFARLMRWDPVLAAVAGALTRQGEFSADRAAVELTGRPEPLARALEKLLASGGSPGSGRFVSGLFGRDGAPNDREIRERIARLRDGRGSGARGGPRAATG